MRARIAFSTSSDGLLPSKGYMDMPMFKVSFSSCPAFKIPLVSFSRSSELSNFLNTRNSSEPYLPHPSPTFESLSAKEERILSPTEYPYNRFMLEKLYISTKATAIFSLSFITSSRSSRKCSLFGTPVRRS